ncbi:MAG: UPF0182 family protein [Candidatus Dormibacteria bacterium]
MAFRGRGGGDFFSNVEPLFQRGGPPRPPEIKLGTGTRRGLYFVGALVVLLFLLRPFVGFYTDLLWFRSLGYEQLYLTRFRYQGSISLAAFVLAFAALAVSNAYAVRQVGFRALSAIGVRRGLLTAAAGRLAILVSALIAFVMALVASGSWATFARAFNGVAFNRSDALFGQDIGVYVFQLPLARFAWGWMMALVAICIAGALFIYLSAGGAQGLSARATTHLSLLAAAFFVLLAVHYRLAMFDLLLGQRGFVFGAGYTDVHVRLPMYWVLLVLCGGLAVLMVVNAVLRRPALLVGSPVVWLMASLLLLLLVPAIVQRATVTPSELSQEQTYIQREIDATNQAFALDKLELKSYPAKPGVPADLVARNPGTINNVRLWDYVPLQTAYNQIQTIRQYYDFNRVAIDRYNLSDGYHQVMLSARELSPDRLPATVQTWLNIHLKYTHGYGAAATEVSKASPEGQPQLALSGIPPIGEPALTRPQIYFGETSTGYVIAATAEPEVDYEKDGSQVYSRWTGTHGVQLSGGLRRLAYAYQLGDLNLLLSSQVTSGSQLLYRRDVKTRLQQLAPFLTFDQDPYLVVSEGRMYWIVDALTSSDAYPYSKPVDDLGTNYVRNSVKVVMDAYEGTVTMYAADPADPILATYQRIFPNTFVPIDQMPPDLRKHVRYPESLFNIQARVLETYHMHNPQDFYNRSDAWSQPGRSGDSNGQGGGNVLEPYYVVMKLPGQDHEEFVLIQPFTPLNRKNMVAWMAARSDGADYGKLAAFRFPTDRQVTGPEQVQSRVDQDPVISSQYSLLNQNGSRIIRGNLLVIPIEDSILFVEPIYIASTGTAIPELKKVVVGDEQRVVWADTLDLALQALTSGSSSPPTSTTTPTGTTPTTTPSPAPAGDVQTLIGQANSLYTDSQAKLKAGDFAGYASDIQQLGRVLDQLKAATKK